MKNETYTGCGAHAGTKRNKATKKERKKERRKERKKAGRKEGKKERKKERRKERKKEGRKERKKEGKKEKNTHKNKDHLMLPPSGIDPTTLRTMIGQSTTELCPARLSVIINYIQR